MFTEEINKIALRSNDDNRFQIFDRVTSYPCGANTRKVCETELLEYLNIKWLTYNYTNDNKTKHNPKSPYFPDHPYLIPITGGSGSGKTNALSNLINNQPDIDKIYFHAKDPYEAKYQYLINNREDVEIRHVRHEIRQIILNLCKRLYSNDMEEVYKNIKENNSE